MNDPPALAADSPAAQRARRLDRLCDHFEAAWKAGRRPSLERYLGNVPPAARAELFRELLVLELDYRGRRGEKPQREEYRLRFPEHAELIDTVFGESRPQASSTPSLLRRWSVNRLAHELRKSLFPAERHGAPGVEGGALSAGSSVSGSSPPAQIFSLLARLLGAGSAEPDLAGASGSGEAGMTPTPPPGNGCRPEGAVAGVYGLPTQLLEPGKLPNGGASGKECPAGTVLGDYELLERLGKGGMGIVYRARQRSANRIVALKVIRPDRLEELSAQECQEWFERFRREGQIAACIEDEHLVTVYEVGQAGGQLFYSMRYVEGQSLAEILRKGPLPNQRSALYMEHVAQALHVLHLRGTVHRDVKPRNILVDTKDRPFLTDYGLAKSSAYAQGLTQFGSCMGTPEYMSPEQARDSAAAGPPSDIYSLGATLYESLTGRPPFRAADALETLRQVQDDEPLSPRRLNPAVHRDLELICLKCLQKEPHKRYATALEAAEELHRYQAGEPLRHTRPVTNAERVWRWCRRKPALAAACSLAVLGLLATFIVSVAFVVSQSRAFLAQRAQLARLALDKGLTRCEQGDVDDGMLWFAHALELNLPDHKDLDNFLRMNLAAWYRLLPVKAALPHPDNVVALAFSQDGQTLLTATSHQAQLWEAATGKPIGQPIELPRRALTAALSPDGKVILTGNEDHTAQLWDATTGQPIGQLLDPEDKVRAVAFSPDGKKVLTGSIDYTARLWNAATGEPIGPPFRHNGPVRAVAFSADGKTILCWEDWPPWGLKLQFTSTVGILGLTGPQGVCAAACLLLPTTVQRWDVEKGLPVAQALPFQEKEISALAFSPDGKAIATVSASVARVWDALTGKQLAGPFGRQVTAVALSTDGKRLLTGSADKTAQLWDVVSGRALGLPLRHPEEITCLAFSPDGKTIVTGSGRRARLWGVAPIELYCSCLQAPGPVYDAAFSRDGRLLLTGGGGGAQLWDVAKGEPYGNRFHGGTIQAVAFSRDGKTVLTGSMNGTALLWDVERRKPIALLQPQEPVHAVAFSSDGRWALTGGGGGPAGSAQLWDAATGKSIGLPLRHGSTVYGVAFGAHDKTIVTASADRTAQVWDATTRLPSLPPFTHQSAVFAMGLSSNGKLLLTGSHDEGAKLWDLATGALVCPPLLHQGAVRAVALSPDNRLALTGSYDQCARLWDTRTGAEIGPPLRHKGKVWSVAYNMDGRFALTGSDDCTAQLWDVATGRPCGPRLRHLKQVTKVAFSPNGKILVTTSRDKTARLWEVPTALEGTAERIVLWTKVITGLALDDAGEARPLDFESWLEGWQRLNELGGPPLSPAALLPQH